MPKIAMDYSKCCIYKIEHIENASLVYVGHTTILVSGKVLIKVVVIMKITRSTIIDYIR